MLLGLTFETLVARLIVLLIAMTVHEFAHNFIADRMGDPEPRRAGRLTLNPFVHINWIGWLMFAIIGFGILGSAPISPFRMPPDRRRWRWLAAVAAGPVSNLLLAVLTAIIIRLLVGLGVVTDLPSIVITILSQMVFFNVILFLFNLIPLFPLDGWQVAYALLPPRQAYIWERYQMTTYYIFFFLILLSFVNVGGINPLGLIIGQPARWIMNLLLG